MVLQELIDETRTIIMYEAPHRLNKTLAELKETLGNRNISICKELTKLHENIFRTTIDDAIAYYNNNEPKGGFVLVIQGKSFDEIIEENIAKWDEISIYEHYTQYINDGLNSKDAMKAVAKDRGISKRDVYAEVLSNK